MFTASRLVLARRRRGVTMKRLAEMANLTPRSITAYESEEMTPTDETVGLLARALDFPVEFFFCPDIEGPTAGGASFRSFAAMTARQRDAALASGTLAIQASQWIEERFSLPAADVPDAREFEPDAAAALLRGHWGLGERPIKNMVHLLEARGVRVFSLPADNANVDAFSLWHNNTPFVFLNTLKSGEHGRYDAAHELGHLVLHRHGAPRGREAETEANSFASALLMPEGSVRACVPTMASLDTLIRLKKNWKVSVAALAYRLGRLGLLTEWHYRTLCIQIAERGYRKSEPQGIPRETSQILTKVFAALREEGLTKATVAHDLKIRAADLDAVVFGLVITALPGGRSLSAGRPSSTAKLRTVP